MLANLQNVSNFDSLQVRKISTNKSLQVRIIHVSQPFGKNLLAEKISVAKLSIWIKNFELRLYSGVNCFNDRDQNIPIQEVDLMQEDFQELAIFLIARKEKR